MRNYFRPMMPPYLFLAFCAVFFGCLTACRTGRPEEAPASAAAAVSAAKIATGATAAVAIGAAAALASLCKPDDDKCRAAIIALTAVGGAAANASNTLPGVTTTPAAGAACVPKQEGRALASGEKFCD